MSDEQIDIFAPEPCDVEPARERVVLDPGGEYIAARRADDRRARRRFKATLRREQRERAAATVAAIVSAIGPIHGLFADDPDA